MNHLSPLEHMESITHSYQVVRFIGTGKITETYLCRRKRSRELIVLKALQPSALASGPDDPAVTCFLNEVEALRRVEHFHVMKMFEVLKEPDFVGFAAEYLPGGTLAQLLHRRQEIATERAVDILIALADGFDALHKAGLLTRSFTPAGILLDHKGQPKIADLSEMQGPGLITMWGVKAEERSLYYQSPEYLLSGILHVRGDIYALGCIGYQLLTGTLPFLEATVHSLINAKISSEPLSPDQVGTSCPRELGAILMGTLRREPAQRYASIAEFRSALIDWRRRSKISDALPTSTNHDKATRAEIPLRGWCGSARY